MKNGSLGKIDTTSWREKREIIKVTKQKVSAGGQLQTRLGLRGGQSGGGAEHRDEETQTN